MIVYVLYINKKTLFDLLFVCFDTCVSFLLEIHSKSGIVLVMFGIEPHDKIVVIHFDNISYVQLIYFQTPSSPVSSRVSGHYPCQQSNAGIRLPRTPVPDQECHLLSRNHFAVSKQPFGWRAGIVRNSHRIGIHS